VTDLTDWRAFSGFLLGLSVILLCVGVLTACTSSSAYSSQTWTLTCSDTLGISAIGVLFLIAGIAVGIRGVLRGTGADEEI
jgi:hypothetical protein